MADVTLAILGLGIGAEVDVVELVALEVVTLGSDDIEMGPGPRPVKEVVLETSQS